MHAALLCVFSERYFSLYTYLLCFFWEILYPVNCSPVCFSETYYALQTALLYVFLKDNMVCMLLSCVFFVRDIGKTWSEVH